MDKQCRRNTKHSHSGSWHLAALEQESRIKQKQSEILQFALCTYNQFVAINSAATPSQKNLRPPIFDASCARLCEGNKKNGGREKPSRTQKIANIMATLYNPLLQQIKIYDSAPSGAKVMCMP